MWEKPTGTRESCWCRVTKSVGRGPLQPVAGQTSYSVRERNAARLRTWRPRQSHEWFIKGKYEGRANVVMDGDDTEIVAVDAVESAADVLSGTFKPKHLNPAGGTGQTVSRSPSMCSSRFTGSRAAPTGIDSVAEVMFQDFRKRGVVTL